MKPDQTPGANQDAGGIPVYPAAPEGLSLDVEQVIRIMDLSIIAEGDYQEEVARWILARLSPSSGESGSPPEPFDSQARDLLEACHERNIHSRGDMEYQFQPWAIDEDRLFEALSFLGEDDLFADGSLWKVKEIALNAAAAYNRVGSGSPGEDR